MLHAAPWNLHPPPLTLAIVTGASRGLGHALAQALLAPETRLRTLSRRPCLLAPVAGAVHEEWNVDLAEPQPVAERPDGWLRSWPGPPPASAVMIHNAAALSTLANVPEVPLDEIVRAARVNLEAPLVLSVPFLRATATWPAARKLLFISSGLGRFAMAGAASYCAAQAGLDHLARSLALEESARPRGAHVVSLAPGVIDSARQVQLRATFAERQRFLDVKEGGQLASPAEAAAKALAILARADFGSNAVTDVRDAG